MLTQQFLSLVRDLLTHLQERSSAQQTLAKIGNEYPAIAAEQDGLLSVEVGGLGQQRNNVINKLENAARTIAATSFHSFYRDLDGIQEAVDTFLGYIALAPFPTLDRIKTGIAEFRELLQAFLAQKHRPLDTFRVVVAARTLAELLAGVEESFEVVERELEHRPPADAETVALYYDATPDLRELLKLLDAVLSIWQEISRELGIESEPPTIARLETGSLIAVIVGSPLAIAVLTLMVTQWGRIKNYLDPVGSSSTAIGAAVDLAKLSDFLKSRGIATANLDKTIGRIAQSQAAKLNLATDRIVKVTRNNDDVAIADAMRLLDNKRPPLLRIEHKPDEPNPTS